MSLMMIASRRNIGIAGKVRHQGLYHRHVWRLENVSAIPSCEEYQGCDLSDLEHLITHEKY
jgi:hypothetical protein